MKALILAILFCAIAATAVGANSPPDQFPGGRSGAGGRIAFVE